jgi:glycine betaine/proline transport system substrate-binding protein
MAKVTFVPQQEKLIVVPLGRTGPQCGTLIRTQRRTFHWGKIMRRSLALVPVLALSLFAAACGSSATTADTTVAAAVEAEPAAEPAAAEPAVEGGDKPTIKLVQNAWTASAINTAIAKEVIETQLGNKVEVVEIDENVMFAGLAAGEVDAVLEIWPSGVAADEKKYLEDGSVVNDGDLGVIGKIGWFTPDYVIEKFPALASWEGFKDPATAKAFATAETGDKGRFLGTDPSYSQYDEPIIKNLALPLEVKYSGSEAATIAELDSKVAAKEPVVMYWWTPTAAVGKYNLKNIALPAYNDACYADAAKADCDYPEDKLFKASSAKLAAKDAKVAAFLKKFQLSNEIQLSLLPSVEIDKKDAAVVAKEWLAANEATWKAWLN